MKNAVAAADRMFLFLTAIVLFQLCHVGMHWAFSGIIAAVYFLLLDRRYGTLERIGLAIKPDEFPSRDCTFHKES